MTGILNALIAGVSGAVKDTYFNLVSLLLPGNGTNGATNNSFVDSSTANSGTGWPITRNGDVTQGTFSPFSQTGWGNYFDGSSAFDYAENANLEPGTGDFTFETWVYHTTAAGSANVYYGQATGGLAIYRSGTGGIGVDRAGVASIIGDTTTKISTNTWTHIAVVRSGTASGNIKVYFNGVADATTGSSTADLNGTGTSIQIGRLASSSYMAGYLSNVRFCKAAVYTSNFTPSTSPLTTTSQGATNCNLLISQTNRFKDNSSNNFSPTIVGSPSVTPFSPFAPTSSYSAAAVGGSGYFDGSGDFLTVANSAALSYGTGSFTIEGWFYTAATGQYASIFSDEGSGGTAGLTLLMNPTVGNGQLTLYGNGGLLVTATGKYNDNAWHHFAISRDSTNLRLYVDGAYIGNSASGSTNFDASQPLYLMSSSIAGRTMAGYLSSFRTLKGTALYTGTGSITVPTAPLTNITNTSLLLNFTNGGVIDATAKNVLETEGNAQISTAQSKWGGGSIYFDGTGDYLYKPYDPLLNQLNGNFTIECWIYPTVTNTRMIFAGAANAAGDSNWFWEITAGNKLSFIWTNTTPTVFTATSTASISPNIWTYIAAVKNGGTITQYINGSADGTSSPTGTYRNASYGFGIGRAGDYNGLYLTGYIDDFRMTIGQARTITASPSAPFPVQ